MKTIKQLEKEIEETKDNEIIGISECENCGCELLKGQTQFCENCNGIKVQTLKEVLKLIDELDEPDYTSNVVVRFKEELKQKIKGAKA